MTDLNLNPDGPHSPDHTSQAGTLFDNVSRFITYATMHEKGGLQYPGDVYSLVADLYSATGRIPQMCHQLEAFLRAQAASGRLYEAQGRDIGIQRDRAAIHLEQAAAHAARLTDALQAVQADISGLGVASAREYDEEADEIREDQADDEGQRYARRAELVETHPDTTGLLTDEALDQNTVAVCDAAQRMIAERKEGL